MFFLLAFQTQLSEGEKLRDRFLSILSSYVMWAGGDGGYVCFLFWGEKRDSGENMQCNFCLLQTGLNLYLMEYHGLVTRQELGAQIWTINEMQCFQSSALLQAPVISQYLRWVTAAFLFWGWCCSQTTLLKPVLTGRSILPCQMFFLFHGFPACSFTEECKLLDTVNVHLHSSLLRGSPFSLRLNIIFPWLNTQFQSCSFNLSSTLNTSQHEMTALQFIAESLGVCMHFQHSQMLF